MSNEIVTIENINPALVFVPNGLDPLIERIETEARSQLRDVSTASGRDNIRSLAAKIAKSKTTLDKMGKELGEEYREKVKAINTERGKAVDRLQALQDEIRAPLTAYEDKEKNRVAAHEEAIATLEAKAVFEFEPTLAQVQERLDGIAELATRDWEEFKDRSFRIGGEVIAKLTNKSGQLKKQAEEQAELARLRAAEQERIQKEREERIAAEAAAKAKAEAEERAEKARQAAQAEADRQAKLAEQARRDVLRQKEAAEAALKKAESDKIAAAAKAEADKKAAAEAAAKKERDRQEAEKSAEAKATAAREADKTHRAKINNEALTAIKSVVEKTSDLTGADPYQEIIKAIAKGEIPHVKIQY